MIIDHLTILSPITVLNISQSFISKKNNNDNNNNNNKCC